MKFLAILAGLVGYALLWSTQDWRIPTGAFLLQLSIWWAIPFPKKDIARDE